MVRETDTTHEEFASNWSPAQQGEDLSAQQKKQIGWQPVIDQE